MVAATVVIVATAVEAGVEVVLRQEPQELLLMDATIVLMLIDL